MRHGRIVSLLPSATEIVCALGLRARLVGISHECDFPADVAGLPRVTRTVIPAGRPSAEIDARVRSHLETNQALYALDLERLAKLRPDVLVSQALCDVCAVSGEDVGAAVGRLPGPPALLNLEPMNLAEVLVSIRFVGAGCGAEDAATRLTEQMQTRMDRIVRQIRDRATERPRVAFLEWVEPPFNGGHWTPELIAMAGGDDVFAGSGQASRTRSWDELRRHDPDVLFLASCGFDRSRTAEDVAWLARQPGWADLRCVRRNRVYAADGNQYFNRPGPRLADSLAILAAALHPDAGIDVTGAEPAIRLPVVSHGLQSVELH